MQEAKKKTLTGTVAEVEADHIVLADIYAAREVDTGEVSSKDVMKLLQEDGQDVHYFPSFEEIKDFVKAHVKGHDLLINNELSF